MGSSRAAAKRKAKRNARRARQREERAAATDTGEQQQSATTGDVKEEKTAAQQKEADAVQIEYVEPEVRPPPMLNADFSAILQRFQPSEGLLGDSAEHRGEAEAGEARGEEEEQQQGEESGSKRKRGTKKNRFSKKERKEQKRLRVALLKRLVSKPEVVDSHDVGSADPLFLVHLKSYRNAVRVPRHWKRKRKYLQGKRGVEKIPFQLPEYIAATGIAQMRQAQLEKDAEKKAKQSQRERMQPKMHRLDIDYKVLRDAFFKHQTKPKLTGHGDIYWEGKEYEVDVSTKRPGHLSLKLREALGMPQGAPPPYLINMQRFGPPPSYPQLRIPGLNAPIPRGAEWGYQPGGWGKPPVDGYGRPIYGPVFAAEDQYDGQEMFREPDGLKEWRWGELQQELFEDEGDDEDEDDEMSMSEDESSEVDEAEAKQREAERAERERRAALVPTALAEVENLQLRKNAAEPDRFANRKELVTVLEQKQTTVGDGLYGSSFQYVIPGGEEQQQQKKGSGQKVDVIHSQATGEQVVTLDQTDMEDLEEGDAARLLREKFEAAMQAKEQGVRRVDFSDIHAQHQQKKKKKKKKDDDFKF